MLDFNYNSDFTAVVRPLFDETGREIPSEIGRRVIRDDNDETLGICGPNYTPVQHGDVLDPILDNLEKQGYEIQERDYDQRGLYDLAGNRGCFVKRRFTDNGAVMRTDIITGDFIQPTGSTSYLDDGPDTMLWKISAFNSHNGSLAVRAVTSYERLLCMNGQTRPDFSAGVYGKHTSGFNFEALKRKLEDSMNLMGSDAETFGIWAKTRVTLKEAEAVLQATIAKLPNKANGDAHFSAPLVDKILFQFAREDQTVWGLYQAVTHWQTHGERRENSDAIKTGIGRESRVATMLRTPTWAALTAGDEYGPPIGSRAS